MEWMERVRNSAARFMYGRNGMDALNWAMLGGYIVLYVLRIIVAVVLRNGLFAALFSILYSVLAVALLFRVFSKNLPRRQEENRHWQYWYGRLFRWTERLRGGVSGRVARLKDREHRYFTCKDCGAVCRVPAGRGKIVITCPRCGAKIQAKS